MVHNASDMTERFTYIHTVDFNVVLVSAIYQSEISDTHTHLHSSLDSIPT